MGYHEIYPKLKENGDHRWTTLEIKEEVFAVIKQLLANVEGR